MKTVIVDIKDGFAAVLSEDGTITKILDKGYMIGQVIEMRDNKKIKVKRFIASAAAIAVIIGTGSIGAWAYNTPYTYVSLDVNPSIEFTVNRFDQVIDVTAVNDDGEDIINEINAENLDNQSIEDAIKETVNQISENGYFDPTTEEAQDVAVVSGGGIVISTSSEDEEKADELAGELQEAVEGQVEENGDLVEVEVISVGLERVQLARELGVTPGKLNLVQKLQASAANPDSIILEEWLNKPVKEIMKATKENKKAAKVNAISEEENAEVVEATDDVQSTENIETSTDSNIADTTVKENAKKEKSQDKVTKVEEKAKEKVAKVEEKAKEKATKVEEKANKSKDIEKDVDDDTKVEDKKTKEENNTKKNQDKSSKKIQDVLEETKNIESSVNEDNNAKDSNDRSLGNSNNNSSSNNSSNSGKSKK